MPRSVFPSSPQKNGSPALKNQTRRLILRPCTQDTSSSIRQQLPRHPARSMPIEEAPGSPCFIAWLGSLHRIGRVRRAAFLLDDAAQNGRNSTRLRMWSGFMSEAIRTRSWIAAPMVIRN